MEENSERNDQKIRAMTCKEKVLAIYPNAHIYIMDEKSEWPKFYVRTWVNSRAYWCLARYRPSEESAWITAWDYILYYMIDKLES